MWRFMLFYIVFNVLCTLAYCSPFLPGGSVGCCFSLSGHCYHVFHHPHCNLEEGKRNSNIF